MTKTNGPHVSTRTGISPKSSLRNPSVSSISGAARSAAVQPVRPAVVAALEGLAVALRQRDLAGPVAADVVEAAQLAVEAVGDHDRLVEHGHRHEVADALELIGPGHELPGAAEDPLLLELEDVGIEVVALRNRRGAAERRRRHGRGHARSVPMRSAAESQSRRWLGWRSRSSRSSMLAACEPTTYNLECGVQNGREMSSEECAAVAARVVDVKPAVPGHQLGDLTTVSVELTRVRGGGKGLIHERARGTRRRPVLGRRPLLRRRRPLKGGHSRTFRRAS